MPTRSCRATVPSARRRRSPTLSIEADHRPGARRVIERLRRRAAARHPFAALGGDTRYSWMHTGATGIDPYGGVVSDVYQDVFGRGELHRQGDLRCRCVQRGARGAVPGTPGTLARSSRGQLPTVWIGYQHRGVRRLSVHAMRQAAVRQHRWMRGDWQLLLWLFPYVRTAGAAGSATRYPSCTAGSSSTTCGVRLSLLR